MRSSIMSSSCCMSGSCQILEGSAGHMGLDGIFHRLVPCAYETSTEKTLRFKVLYGLPGTSDRSIEGAKHNRGRPCQRRGRRCSWLCCCNPPGFLRYVQATYCVCKIAAQEWSGICAAEPRAHLHTAKLQVRWALKHHGVAYKVIGYTPLVGLYSLHNLSSRLRWSHVSIGV